MRLLEETHEIQKTKLLKEIDDINEKQQTDISSLNSDYQNKLKIAYAQHDRLVHEYEKTKTDYR